MPNYPNSYTHLKRESPDPRRSNANAKTLCRKDDPGVYAYATVEVGEPLPEPCEVYPTCPECAAAHLAEIL